MQKIRAFGCFWLPLLLWMALIFAGSSDTLSTVHSSRIIAPVMHFLFPRMSDEAVNQVVFFARKCAHLTEYGILVLLALRLCRHWAGRRAYWWDWRDAGVALLVAALYAAVDEYHQTFVRGREGCVRDVIIDTCGAAAAIFLIWVWGRWRKRW